MIKVTVLSGHPKKPHAFEQYYPTTHLQFVAKMSGVSRAELTQFLPVPDGSAPT